MGKASSGTRSQTNSDESSSSFSLASASSVDGSFVTAAGAATTSSISTSSKIDDPTFAFRLNPRGRKLVRDGTREGMAVTATGAKATAATAACGAADYAIKNNMPASPWGKATSGRKRRSGSMEKSSPVTQNAQEATKEQSFWQGPPLRRPAVHRQATQPQLPLLGPQQSINNGNIAHETSIAPLSCALSPFSVDGATATLLQGLALQSPKDANNTYKHHRHHWKRSQNTAYSSSFFHHCDGLSPFSPNNRNYGKNNNHNCNASYRCMDEVPQQQQQQLSPQTFSQALHATTQNNTNQKHHKVRGQQEARPGGFPPTSTMTTPPTKTAPLKVVTHTPDPMTTEQHDQSPLGTMRQSFYLANYLGDDNKNALMSPPRPRPINSAATTPSTPLVKDNKFVIKDQGRTDNRNINNNNAEMDDDDDEDDALELTPLPKLTLFPRRRKLMSPWGDHLSHTSASECGSCDGRNHSTSLPANVAKVRHVKNSEDRGSNKATEATKPFVPIVTAPSSVEEGVAPVITEPERCKLTTNRKLMISFQDGLPQKDHKDQTAICNSCSVELGNQEFDSDGLAAASKKAKPATRHNSHHKLLPNHADVSFIPLPDWNDDSPTRALNRVPKIASINNKEEKATTPASIFQPASGNTVDEPIDCLMIYGGGRSLIDSHIDKGMVGDFENESLSSSGDEECGFLLVAPSHIEEEKQAHEHFHQQQLDHQQCEEDVEVRPTKHLRRVKEEVRPTKHLQRAKEDTTRDTAATENDDSKIQATQFHNALRQHDYHSSMNTAKSEKRHDDHNTDENSFQENYQEDSFGSQEATLATTAAMKKSDSIETDKGRDFVTPPAMAQGSSPPPLLAHSIYHHP